MGKASRRKRERRAAEQALLAGLRAEGFARDVKMCGVRRAEDPSTREEAKLSARLAELLSPCKEEKLEADDYRTLAKLGMLGWNLAVLQGAVGEKDLLQALGWGADSNLAPAEDLIQFLKERKEQLFPEDRRFIVRVEVSELTDGSFYLVTAGTILQGRTPEPAGT